MVPCRLEARHVSSVATPCVLLMSVAGAENACIDGVLFEEPYECRRLSHVAAIGRVAWRLSQYKLHGY